MHPVAEVVVASVPETGGTVERQRITVTGENPLHVTLVVHAYVTHVGAAVVTGNLLACAGAYGPRAAARGVASARIDSVVRLTCSAASRLSGRSACPACGTGAVAAVGADVSGDRSGPGGGRTAVHAGRRRGAVICTRRHGRRSACRRCTAVGAAAGHAATGTAGGSETTSGYGVAGAAGRSLIGRTGSAACRRRRAAYGTGRTAHGRARAAY